MILLSPTQTPTVELYVIAAPGLEPAVAAELEALGFTDLRPERGGVTCVGDPAVANLHLRAATRVLARVATFKATRFTDLSREAAKIDWSPYGGLTPKATCRKSRLYHSGAVEEALAKSVPPGPGVLMARLHRDVCTLSVDTSGERLHRRGWRLENGPAPLRESLASGLLRLAGWDPATPLYDPMCGSGTFLIEGALWAAGVPPGQIRAEGDAEIVPAPASGPQIFGSDRSAPTIKAAQRNAERAGISSWLSLKVCEAGRAAPPPDAPPGLVICNPPYGRRVDAARHAMARLREGLGAFPRWSVALFAPPRQLADDQASKMWDRPIVGRHRVDNGGLKTALLVLGPQGA